MGMELQVMNPVYEKANMHNKIGQIVPLYSLTSGLTNNEIVKIVNNVLKEYLDFVQEILPTEIRGKYNLIGIKEAIRNIHFPSNRTVLEASKRRLIFEELFILQLGLFIIKNKSLNENSGVQFPKVKEIDEFIDNLPFKLTSAQKRVFQEIQDDMSSTKQMSRLVQGDVGSGKTIVAALAMFRSVKAGYQAAMMAPTEILAVQHFESLNTLFKDYNIRCELLVGSLTDKNK